MTQEERQRHIDHLKNMLANDRFYEPEGGNTAKALTAAIAALEREGQMEAEVQRLREDLSTMTQAVGLATTSVPSMEIDVSDPIGMMHKVVAEVKQLREENAKRKAHGVTRRMIDTTVQIFMGEGSQKVIDNICDTLEEHGCLLQPSKPKSLKDAVEIARGGGTGVYHSDTPAEEMPGGIS